LPGCALALAAIAGWAASARDLPDYFVPLRARTAAVLRGERGAFWNPDVGCGEPYFANPQTALLYPPAWLALLLPAERACGAEVGLHLALLGLGCALLARRLGARPALQVAAAWGTLAAGPVLDAAGVLNNLDTLAWLPWLWWAGAAGSLTGIAGFAALAWLGAEPHLALVGVLVAVVLTPRRRTLAGVLLAAGLVAVQALPFLAWVHDGERGPERPAVTAAALPDARAVAALAAPGVPVANVAERFVAHPTLPLWVLLLAGAALVRGRGRVRRLAAAGFVLAATAVAADTGFGARAWAFVTRGLASYPQRLLFPAAVALAVAATCAVPTRRRWWTGLTATAAFGVVAALAGGSLIGGLAQGVSAGLAVAGFFPGAATLAGAAALAAGHTPVLELRHAAPAPAVCVEAQQAGGGRVYSVPPSRQQLRWVMVDRRRVTSLGLGYSNLMDGRRTVRTFAPVQSRRLADHLAAADRGPEGRWWLDSLAATTVVAHYPVPEFPESCRAGDLTVGVNHEAWPESAVVRRLPAPGELPVHAGEVVATNGGDDQVSWQVRVAAGGGILLLAATPDPGWSLVVDGQVAPSVEGPGILHGVRLTAGAHAVRAGYRPPFLVAGAVVSLVACLLLMGATWWRPPRRRSRPGGPQAITGETRDNSGT
jgi:hypothetical protein